MTYADTHPARHRILVIDDEPEVRDVVIRTLEEAGYSIDAAADGAAGLRLALSGNYQLIVLDLVMPLADGRQVLSMLHQHRPDQHVLVLSCLSDTATKVYCLDLGAQDFLAKPFSLEELLARIRVQLRDEHQATADERRAGERAADEHPAGDVIRAGHLTLDLGRMQADAGLGPIPLTRLEVLLLRELMDHTGESVTKGSLLASVWGIDFDPGSNVVDVCVRRLRSKLGFGLIETVRGAGYRLAS
jgi:two-component system, OmpR family, response regulator